MNRVLWVESESGRLCGIASMTVVVEDDSCECRMRASGAVASKWLRLVRIRDDASIGDGEDARQHGGEEEQGPGEEGGGEEGGGGGGGGGDGEERRGGGIGARLRHLIDNACRGLRVRLVVRPQPQGVGMELPEDELAAAGAESSVPALTCEVGDVLECGDEGC